MNILEQATGEQMSYQYAYCLGIISTLIFLLYVESKRMKETGIARVAAVYLLSFFFPIVWGVYALEVVKKISK